MDVIITNLNMQVIEFFLSSLEFCVARSLEYERNFFYWIDVYKAKSLVFHHKNASKFQRLR